LVGIDNDNVETAQAIRSSIYRKVFTTSASSIPEEDRSFDLVISNSVLEHIPDLEPVIAEVSRVLKTDGKFIFTVPGPDFHKCLRGPKKEIARTQYLREMDQRLAHYHYLGVGEWRDLLAKSQMEVREYVGYLNCKETQRWELISNLTGGLLWRLSGKKDAPIQMQRKLGFRQLQNKYKTPRLVANLLGRLLLLGMRNTDAQNQNACLLVVAQKTS
jgi:SAM-dependent methyltransferase